MECCYINFFQIFMSFKHKSIRMYIVLWAHCIERYTNVLSFRLNYLHRIFNLEFSFDDWYRKWRLLSQRSTVVTDAVEKPVREHQIGRYRTVTRNHGLDKKNNESKWLLYMVQTWLSFSRHIAGYTLWGFKSSIQSLNYLGWRE